MIATEIKEVVVIETEFAGREHRMVYKSPVNAIAALLQRLTPRERLDAWAGYCRECGYSEPCGCCDQEID